MQKVILMHPKFLEVMGFVSQIVFVWFESLHPSQHFFSHVGVEPVLSTKVSYSRTQHSDSVGGESRTGNSNALLTEPLRSTCHNWHFMGPLFACLCHLLITFANSLDPDQARQNVGPEMDPKSLTLMVFLENVLKT